LPKITILVGTGSTVSLTRCYPIRIRCEAAYSCSPEGHPYPGLHQENCGQQVEGRDSAPLLYSGEISPGVLRPALEPPARERHGAIGAGPEKPTKMIRGLEHLSCDRWDCLACRREGYRET